MVARLQNLCQEYIVYSGKIQAKYRKNMGRMDWVCKLSTYLKRKGDG